jgi:hypothetical protein
MTGSPYNENYMCYYVSDENVLKPLAGLIQGHLHGGSIPLEVTKTRLAPMYSI